MKTLLITFAVAVLFAINCNGQPNTSTTLEVGIVNPQPEKSYLVFIEVDTDTLNPRLIDNMDYLAPNVSDLMVNITGWVMDGDTLFGELNYQDLTYIRYANGGLVQVNDNNTKYSAMAVAYWTDLDMVEPNAAGFIFRRK